jgi:hypothetical protein
VRSLPNSPLNRETRGCPACEGAGRTKDAQIEHKFSGRKQHFKTTLCSEPEGTLNQKAIACRVDDDARILGKPLQHHAGARGQLPEATTEPVVDAQLTLEYPVAVHEVLLRDRSVVLNVEPVEKNIENEEIRESHGRID